MTIAATLFGVLFVVLVAACIAEYWRHVAYMKECQNIRTLIQEARQLSDIEFNDALTEIDRRIAQL